MNDCKINSSIISISKILLFVLFRVNYEQVHILKRSETLLNITIIWSIGFMNN